MWADRLAKNLVVLRRARGLSQQTLAKMAGIPRSTLAHAESGCGNPTLETVASIATALQVTWEEMLASRRPECLLQKGADLSVVERIGGAARIVKLLPDPVKGMEIDRIELAQGVRMRGIPHLPHTKEYATVIQGQMVVYVAGDSYSLEAGDVLAFPGDRTHSYHNVGEELVIAISVVVIAPVI